MVVAAPTPSRTPPAIAALLERLRRRIRRYVLEQGMATALVWLALAFWGTLAIDWFFEPPAWVRGILLAVALAGLAAIVLEMIVRRSLVRLSDNSMALLLERYFPEFQDSLLTAVELSGRHLDPEECDPEMLARSCRLAERPLGTVHLSRVFNPRPLRQAILAAALLWIGVGIYAVRLPEMVSIWVARDLLLADDVFWPRSVHLEIEGFSAENGYTVKVAKGTDFEVVVKADLAYPVVPEKVQIRYRNEGGTRDRRTMSREGAGDPARGDRFQHYTYTFRGVLAPVEFDVTGGDATLSGLRIEVVDNPAIVEMQIDCRYPAYMQRPPQTLPVTATLMPISAGSQLTLRARTNKDLVGVEVQSSTAGGSRPLAAEEAAQRRGFQLPLGTLKEDTTLLFTLVDTDGIRSREPVRLTLARVDDKLPELSVQLHGIGPAVTPRAFLPARGKVTDDHGLARIWFEFVIDEAEAREKTAWTPRQGTAAPAGADAAGGNPTEVPFQQAFEVRDLGLLPGKKLLLALKAADRCDLAGKPNVGTSQRWLLDIVTPEQLRAMLEARELSQRQRFAAIIQEVAETRDSLARLQWQGEADSARPKQGAEPGDRPAQVPDDRLEVARRRVERAIQYSQKNASETAAVAEAFRDIREELVNNRIDTEELKLRLQGGIIEPLQRIAEQMFPESERQLERLFKDLADPQTGARQRTESLARLDAILAAMRQVLARMVELEDYNELVERLRSIIQEQEKLHEQIKRRQKERLDDLLE